jgi:hypothetical protein
MLTRVAIYEGTIDAAAAEAFFDDVRQRLEPIWRSFPNVLDVRVLRVTRPDPDAEPTVMILEMDYSSMQALEESLNSDIKTRAHALTLEVLKPFAGRFYHLITEGHRA